MLKITRLIEITAGRRITKIDINFCEKITDFYQLINAKFTPEDLVFLLACPDTSWLENGSPGPWKPYPAVDGDWVQNWELKLSLLNRVVNNLTVAGTGSLSYRDSVFLTVFLGKLGIPDKNLFMKRIFSVKEDTEDTARLIALYWAESRAAKDFFAGVGAGGAVAGGAVAGGAVSGGAVSGGVVAGGVVAGGAVAGGVVAGGVGPGGAESGGDALYKSVYRRLDTRMIYHDVERFYRSEYLMSGKIGRELLLLSAHVRAADQLLLAELREYVSGTACPPQSFPSPYEISGVAERHPQETEGDREEKVFSLWRETDTVKELATAVLFNLAERSCYAYSSAGEDEARNRTFIELRPHPGGLAGDTLKRYFYYHLSAAAYGETEEFYSWIVRNAKKQETALLTLLLPPGEEGDLTAGGPFPSDTEMKWENRFKKEIFLWIRKEERELRLLAERNTLLQKEQGGEKKEFVLKAPLLFPQSEVLATATREYEIRENVNDVQEIREGEIYQTDMTREGGMSNLLFRLQKLMAWAGSQAEKGEARDRERLENSLARLTCLSDFLTWESLEENEFGNSFLPGNTAIKQKEAEVFLQITRQKMDRCLDGFLRLTNKAEEMFQSMVRRKTRETFAPFARRGAVSYIPEDGSLPVSLLGLIGGGTSEDDTWKYSETAGFDRVSMTTADNIQSLKERMDRINEKNVLMQSMVKSYLEDSGQGAESEPALPDRKKTREAALKALESPGIWMNSLQKMQRETSKQVWGSKVQAILEHADGLTKYLLNQTAVISKESGAKGAAMGLLLLDAGRVEEIAGITGGEASGGTKGVVPLNGERKESGRKFLSGAAGAGLDKVRDREVSLPPIVLRQDREWLRESEGAGQGPSAGDAAQEAGNGGYHLTAEMQSRQIEKTDLNLKPNGRAGQSDARIQSLIEKGLKRQIGDISEKVYERLEKRLKSEQVRRGR